MKARAFLLVSLAFLIASCAKEDKPIVPENEEITTPGDSVNYESFYYCVNVNKGKGTKVTLDGGNYVFEEDDALYVISLNDPDHDGEEAGKVWGKLPIDPADVGKTSASFSGPIYKEGGFDPYDDLPMKATLVSEGDKIHEISSNKVTATVYPQTTNSIAPDLATAVSWYGDFTGTSTYSAASYSLSQNSAFITITVTFDEASGIATTAKDVTLSFKTNPNATSNDRTATISKLAENNYVTGVLAVPGGSPVLDYDNLSVSWDGIYKYFSFSSAAAGTSLAANQQYTFSRTVEDDFYNDFFTIENATVSNVTLTFREPDGTDVPHGDGIIQKSTDGVNWETIVEDNTSESIHRGWIGKAPAASIILTASGTAGDKVYLRGTYVSYQSAVGKGNVIQMTGNCYAYGDMMYMVGTMISSVYTKGTDLGAQAFNRFFYSNNKLLSMDGRDGSSELRKLEIGTSAMDFWVSQSSCKQMFNGCKNITMAPELWSNKVRKFSTPGTKDTGSNIDLDEDGYYFTETAYSQMFKGCTGLLFAPMIALTTPHYNTFGEMFYGCTSLRYIQCLAKIPTLGSTFSTGWVNSVPNPALPLKAYFIYNKDLGDVDAATTYWGGRGNNGIPNGANWIILPSE